MYAGPVHLDAFALALAASRAPVCYNGDIRTPADIRALSTRFPAVKAAMIGRGLTADPALVTRARGGASDRETLRRFHEELCAAYCEAFGGPGSAIHRMKAIWALMLEDLAGGEAYGKRLAKTRKWPEFLALTGEILDRLPPRPEPEASPFAGEEEICTF